MQFDGFDWDEGNRDKCRKHGVSLEEIEQVIALGPGLTPDPDHSVHEVRFRAIGPALSGRWVFLVITLRERDGGFLVRPISARYMHAREIAHYEKAQAASGPEER